MKLKILILLLTFIVFSSGCLTTDVIQGVEFTPKQYINASNITVIGAASTSGGLQNISEINQGYFNVSEGNAQPFYVVVNFTNITNFSFLEAKARYFSTSGTPSSHVVDLEIYCTVDNEYEDIFFLENAIEWRYFTRHFPDSMHFIDAQGNVSIKFNHSSNGNVNHVLWIDTLRLITSVQYEQNNIVLNQYFNTTGGTGTVNDSSLNLKVNKTGDIMTGQLDIFGELNTTSWNATQQPLFKNIYNIIYNHNLTDPCTDNASGNCPVIIQEMGTNKSVITVKHRLNPVNDAYGILVNAEITNVTTLQNNSKSGWGFFARPTNDDFYVGRFTPGLSEFTIRVISNTTFAISQKNTTVLNISVANNISLPGIPGANAASTGAAYLCYNYSRKDVYVGTPGC